MKINRKTTIKIIIFLCFLLLMSLMGVALIIKTIEINEPYAPTPTTWNMSTTDFTIERWVEIAQKPSEVNCNFSNYHDPNEFHRIYYNAYAEFTNIAK